MFKISKDLFITLSATVLILAGGFYYLITSPQIRSQNFEIVGFERANAENLGSGTPCAINSDCSHLGNNFYCYHGDTISCTPDINNTTCGTCGVTWNSGACLNNSYGQNICQFYYAGTNHDCGVCQLANSSNAPNGPSGPNCQIPGGADVYKFRIKKPEALFANVDQNATSTNMVYFTSGGFANFNIGNNAGVGELVTNAGTLLDDIDQLADDNYYCGSGAEYRDYVIKNQNNQNTVLFLNCLSTDATYVFFRGLIFDYQPTSQLDDIVAANNAQNIGNFIVTNSAGNKVVVIDQYGNLYLTGCYRTDVDLLNIPSAPIIAGQTYSQTQLRVRNTNIYHDDDLMAPTHFEIYRSSDINSNGSLVASSASLLTFDGHRLLNYIDNGLSVNTEYYYKVKACNNNGCSAFSNQITKTTCSIDCPNPPQNVPLTHYYLTNRGRLNTLSWDPVSGIQGYEIYRNGQLWAYKLIDGQTIYTEWNYVPPYQYNMYAWLQWYDCKNYYRNCDEPTVFVDGHPPFTYQGLGHGETVYWAGNVDSGTTYTYQVKSFRSYTCSNGYCDSITVSNESDLSDELTVTPYFKYLFVTRGWASAADDQCNWDGNNSSAGFLPAGTYKGIISNGSRSARDVVPSHDGNHVYSFILSTSEFVATSSVYLLDNGVSYQLAHPINQGAQPDPEYIYSTSAVTGAVNNGSRYYNNDVGGGVCGSNWENRDPLAGTTIGNTTSATSGWINHGYVGCASLGQNVALYCVQQ